MPVITEQFTNFASSTVAGGAGGAGTGLAAGDVSLLLSTGAGNALFPATTNGTWKLLAGDPLGLNELMLVTTRASDTLTVVRAQEGTSAQTWAYGTPVQAVVTAGSWQTLYARVTAPAFYVRDYGAVGDGATDDSVAIQAALDACNAAGGGSVIFEGKLYIAANLVIYSNVHLRGAGITATTLKLKTAANVDLLSGGVSNVALINIGAAPGSGNNGGLSNWSISDMTLGGFKGNQSLNVADPTTAPTTSGASTVGGFLKASTSYTFAYTYKSALGETRAVGPAAPSAAATLNTSATSGGSLPAGTYGIGYYWIAQTGQTSIGASASAPIVLGGTTVGTLTMNQPAALPTGVTGYQWFMLYDPAGLPGPVGTVQVGVGGTFLISAQPGSASTYPLPAAYNAVSYNPGASGTNTNQITLTAPALPAGATGTNWYLVATTDGTAVVGFVGTSGTNTLAVTTNPTGWTATTFPPAFNTTTQSYCLRVYGYGFKLHNVHIANGFSGGLLVDWNGNTTPAPDSMEAQVTNLKVHDCNNVGLVWGGPHDSVLTNVQVFKSGSHNVYIGPHAPGIQWANFHSWGSAVGVGAVSVLCEGNSAVFSGCQIEGSDVAQLALLGNFCIVGDTLVYGQDVLPASAVQIGQQAALVPYALSSFQSGGKTTAFGASGCSVDVGIQHSSGANGAIWLANEFQQSAIRASIWMPAAGKPFTGVPAAGTQLALAVYGELNATVDSVLATGGAFAVGQSASALALAAAGTVPTFGIAASRVNPAGAVAGIILASGVYAGQVAWVVNESAFTVTFAAAGTSHVADGVADVIAATTARGFVWDSGTALWYRMA